MPSLEASTGQGDTISLCQAVQEEQFQLQVRAGTSTEKPQLHHGVRSFCYKGQQLSTDLLT